MVDTEATTTVEDLAITMEEPEIMWDLAKEVVVSKVLRVAFSKTLGNFMIVKDSITSQLGRSDQVKEATMFSPPVPQNDPGS